MYYLEFEFRIDFEFEIQDPTKSIGQDVSNKLRDLRDGFIKKYKEA